MINKEIDTRNLNLDMYGKEELSIMKHISLLEKQTRNPKISPDEKRKICITIEELRKELEELYMKNNGRNR